MSDSGSNFEFDFNNNKILGELDENGDLTYFEAKIKAFKARFKKKISKKEMDKLRFDTTGIPQLATVAPNPLDREDLIDKEFSCKSITLKPWFSLFITIAASVFDFSCYVMMFENMVSATSDISDALYFAAGAAALAIDVLPAFFARLLHIITKNHKLVLKVFFIFSSLFICIFLVVCFAVRCEFFSTYYGHLKITDDVVIQCLIPIATTLVCFIVNYLAYDPYEKKLKTLKKIKLFREENINELNATIIEIDSELDYMNRLLEQDKALYEGAQKRIESVGNHYRKYVRNVLMITQSSPADTSDLSV